MPSLFSPGVGVDVWPGIWFRKQPQPEQHSSARERGICSPDQLYQLGVWISQVGNLPGPEGRCCVLRLMTSDTELQLPATEMLCLVLLHLLMLSLE